MRGAFTAQLLGCPCRGERTKGVRNNTRRLRSGKCGSHTELLTGRGAEKVRKIQRLLVTCVLHDVDPYISLVGVLQRIDRHPQSQVQLLTSYAAALEADLRRRPAAISPLPRIAAKPRPATVCSPHGLSTRGEELGDARRLSGVPIVSGVWPARLICGIETATRREASFYP